MNEAISNGDNQIQLGTNPCDPGPAECRMPVAKQRRAHGMNNVCSTNGGRIWWPYVIVTHRALQRLQAIAYRPMEDPRLSHAMALDLQRWPIEHGHRPDYNCPENELERVSSTNAPRWKLGD